MDIELKKIKKQYGEDMMHLCKELFPTLLEHENVLFNILNDNIAPTKFLYGDLVNNKLVDEFTKFVLSFVKSEKKANEALVNSNQTPEELLKKKGYKLYHCTTARSVQKFKKYYAKGEELCTFHDKSRIDRCHIFFAVKENVKSIKRSDFKDPKRQDPYGTSVISIQFTKGDVNTLSIKNRYNHKVNKPDATFSNNLENIEAGLTRSFEKYYGLDINQEIDPTVKFFTEKLSYVKANDGKYYRYNYEIDDVHYCENNIIVDCGQLVKKYNKNKERYILMDYFVLDLKEKKLSLYPRFYYLESFIDLFNDMEGKIEVKNIDKTKVIRKYSEDENKNITNEISITINEANQIIEIKDNNIEELPDYFFYFNKYINKIDMPNLKKIGMNVMVFNQAMTDVNLRNVKSIGDGFLKMAQYIKSVNLDSVKRIGNDVFTFAVYLKELSLPNVLIIGDNFLTHNEYIEKIDCPKLMSAGDYFMTHNCSLREISFPALVATGSNFISCGANIEKAYLPSLERASIEFLSHNRELYSLYAPNLKVLRDKFLNRNLALTTLDLPSVFEIDNYCLANNRIINKVNLPKAKIIGTAFLKENTRVKKVEMNDSCEIGPDCFGINFRTKTKKLKRKQPR